MLYNFLLGIKLNISSLPVNPYTKNTLHEKSLDIYNNHVCIYPNPLLQPGKDIRAIFKLNSVFLLQNWLPNQD